MMLRCCTAVLALTTVVCAQTGGGGGAGNSGDSGVVSPFFPDVISLFPGGGGPSDPPGDSGTPGDGNDSGPGLTAGLRVGSARANSGRAGNAGSSGLRSGSGNARSAADYGIDDSWLMWWETNKFDFIELHRIQDAPLSGQGRITESDEQRSRRLAQIRTVLDESVLPLLRELTEAPDPAVRAAATVSLCKLQDAEGAELAKGMLLDGSFDVRLAAMLALGVTQAGRASYQLVSIAADAKFGRKLLKTSSLSDVLRGTALLAASIRSEGATGMIIDELLDDPDEISGQLLAAACEAAGLSRDTRHIAGLTDIARDDSQPEFVRSTALNALGRIGDPAVVPTLLAALDQGIEPRRAAAVALGYTAHGGLSWVIDRLVETVLDDSDAATRHFAAITLGRLGGEQARTALTAAFVKPASDMRPWIALGLALCERADPQGNVVGLLIEKAERESNADNLAAYMLALGLAGGDEAFEALIEYIDDAKLFTSSHAALALGLTRHPDAHPVLRKALEQNSSPLFQQRAAFGLGLLGNSAVVPSLVKLIQKSGNAPVASFAAMAIGLLGDENAIGPLLQIIEREGPRGVATTYAVVAVGQLFDSDRRPALSRLAAGDNYLARSNAANSLLLLGF
jgi:HEAT repeat protein